VSSISSHRCVVLYRNSSVSSLACGDVTLRVERVAMTTELTVAVAVIALKKRLILPGNGRAFVLIDCVSLLPPPKRRLCDQVGLSVCHSVCLSLYL